MKHRLYILTVLLFSTFIMFSFLKKTKESPKLAQNTSIYDIEINSISNDPINLNEFKGKKILFVNVASKCGYTPQYKDLQALHDKYKENLVLIGVPCNQFLNQEPGSPQEIAEFCQKNYGVTFLITEKIKVKGSEKHPLYQWLTEKKHNGKMDSKVKWNFQKYLVNEKGELMEVFYSGTKPLSDAVISAINT